MWTITFRRFKRNRRGVSNIIVVVLSLVIILAIVSNIVLWNYEMNQVDWEKMKEEAGITNVLQLTTGSSWIVLQEEFNINLGSQTGGTYLNTQTVDDIYEGFTEAGGGSGNVTLVNGESFEGSWPPSGWTETDSWNKENNYAWDGSYSADFDGDSVGVGRSGYLTSPIMDCSDAGIIYIDFWWYDRGLDSDDFELEYYDGGSWDNYIDLNQVESVNGWHHFTEAITDSQYFVANFQIRWWAKTVWSGETGCVDLVTVKKSTSSGSYVFDLSGQFNINLSTYPIEEIQTIEVQLRYRADDATEKWYLKAYNWTSSTYTDAGLNYTNGHTPTTGWDYYTVNFTDVWQSYVFSNGTILVKFVDQGGDVDQTAVDIDFLGVRVKMEGTQFTIKNDGALTLHLVSLWVINSTNHQRYDINVFVNSGATKHYLRSDINLPTGSYTVKFVSERGNIAVYSVTGS